MTPGQCDGGHSSLQSARKSGVWAWMTDKYRKMMNGGVGYITIDISQRGGGQRKEKEPQEKERGPWDVRGVGDFSPRARVLFSLGRWVALFCVFFTPKTSRRLIRAQLLDPLFTNSLYWAWSENHHPTFGAVYGKVACATMSAVAC